MGGGSHGLLVDAVRRSIPNRYLTRRPAVALRGVTGLSGEPDLLIISAEPALIVVEVETSFSATAGLKQVEKYLKAVRDKPAEHIVKRVQAVKPRTGRPAFIPLADLCDQQGISEGRVLRWIERAKARRPQAIRGVFAASATDTLPESFLRRLYSTRQNHPAITAVAIQGVLSAVHKHHGNPKRRK